MAALDYLTLFKLIPLALTLVLVAVFLLFVSGVALRRTRPPTDEPVIGHWRFILKGSGGSVEGLTTTAREAADSSVISRLRELDGKGAGALAEVAKELHLYAVRDGRDRVLVASDVGIEGNKYSEGEKGSRFVFPFGPTSYRRTVGFAVDLSRETDPDFFKQHSPEWDRCVLVFPDDVQTGVERSPEFSEKMGDLAQLLVLAKEVSLDASGMRARDEKIRIMDRALRRMGSQVAEEVDRRLLAEEDSYSTSQFEQPGEQPGRRGPLPRMTKGRVATIVLSAAAGYWYLHRYTRLLPNSSAVLGATVMWAFWLLWDNWLNEWF